MMVWDLSLRMSYQPVICTKCQICPCMHTLIISAYMGFDFLLDFILLLGSPLAGCGGALHYWLIGASLGARVAVSWLPVIGLVIIGHIKASPMVLSNPIHFVKISCNTLNCTLKWSYINFISILQPKLCEKYWTLSKSYFCGPILLQNMCIFHIIHIQ